MADILVLERTTELNEYLTDGVKTENNRTHVPPQCRLCGNGHRDHQGTTSTYDGQRPTSKR